MKPVPADVLLRELRSYANATGNKPLEQRMFDLALWYSHHKGSIPLDNLAAKAAFLEKALWIQIEINALLVERVNERKAGSAKLWLPSGMSDGSRHYT
jgi:hypothetical protein